MTRGPSPLGADNNKRRSFGRKSFPLSGYPETPGLTNHLYCLMPSTIWMLAARARLHRGAAHDQLLHSRRRNQGSHLADHRQHQPLVSIGERGAVLFDLRQEANFVLRELSERFLSFTVAWRFGAGEKVRQRDVHGFRDFGERFQRRDGVPVFNTRKVTPQQPGAALDVALRQAALAPIGLDHFSDVYSRLFFWHGLPT